MRIPEKYSDSKTGGLGKPYTSAGKEGKRPERILRRDLQHSIQEKIEVMEHEEKLEKDEVRKGSEEGQRQEDRGPGGEPENEERPPIEEMTKEELISRLKEAEETARRNYDLFLRSQAEIENLKKRFQKDKEELAKFYNQAFIKQILPVVDNLEQALAHSSKEESLPALKEGVELTLKNFKDALNKAGVERIKAEGEAFDPNYHEAMAEVEDDEKSPGTVVEEFQKGYLLNNRLLRPAKVLISKGKGAEKEEKTEH